MPRGEDFGYTPDTLFVVCQVCGAEKHRDFFYKNKRTKCGLSFPCKSCQAEYISLPEIKEQRRNRERRRRLNPEVKSKEKEGRSLYVSKPENKVKIRTYLRSYNKKKRTEDEGYRLKQCLRNRVRDALREERKVGSAVADLGCSVPEAKAHLEYQFQPGMSWDNWGAGVGKWNVDHIMPLAVFDLT